MPVFAISVSSLLSILLNIDDPDQVSVDEEIAAFVNVNSEELKKN